MRWFLFRRRRLKDAAAIIAKLKERSAQAPPGTWIVGQGTYNQVMPTREELDRNFPDHPVVLRWSAHDWLLNHKADEVAGLNDSTPNPGGRGRIERAPNGEPMILRDAGIELPLAGADLPANAAVDSRKFAGFLPEAGRDHGL